MTDEIKISIGPPTDRGRLYPRYDDEADILAVESRVERDWPTGLDIDGALVFDFDRDGVLANFDLHVPKRYWKVAPRLPLPSDARPGDLVITDDSRTKKSFHLPIEVLTDRGYNQVQITFGVIDDRVTPLELSSQCLALTRVNTLVGFIVTFRDGPAGDGV